MKRLLFAFAILVFVVLCAACMDVHEEADSPIPSIAPSVEEVEEADSIQPEEYQVYSTIIDYLINDYYDYLNIRMVVITKFTNIEYYKRVILNSHDYLYEKIPGVDIETIQDFRERNQKRNYLRRKFKKLYKEYKLISEEELETIFSVGVYGWNEFNKKHPGSYGYFSFSRVGFNSEKDQALVCVSHTRGTLRGFGDIYLLSFDGGVWLIEQYVMCVIPWGCINLPIPHR